MRRFDQLQAVDVEGVPPTLRADVDSGNILRRDSPRDYENRYLYTCMRVTNYDRIYYIEGRTLLIFDQGLIDRCEG